MPVRKVCVIGQFLAAVFLYLCVGAAWIIGMLFIPKRKYILARKKWTRE